MPLLVAARAGPPNHHRAPYMHEHKKNIAVTRPKNTITPSVVAAVHRPLAEGPAPPRSSWSEWNLDDGARQMPSAGLENRWLIVSGRAGAVSLAQLVVSAASSSTVFRGLLRFRFLRTPKLLTCSCRTLAMSMTRTVVGSSRKPYHN